MFSPKPKFCVDCKYHVLRIHNDSFGEHFCNAPTGSYNLVTGENKKHYYSCGATRLHESYCGAEGKWWVKRED